MAKSRRASLCTAYPTLAHQDVNLKMARNNQLLHFAFREDKQWKLQQVTRPFPGQAQASGQAGAGLRASRDWPPWGLVAAASLRGRFLAAKLDWVGPGTLEPSLMGGGTCPSVGPQAPAGTTGIPLNKSLPA